MNVQRAKAWMRPFLATMALGGLVALGVGDDGVWFPVVVLLTGALGLGVLFRVFPRGLDFALGSAIGFAPYAALFAVVARTAFPRAPDAVMGLAFFLPMEGFLLAVLSHRAALRRLVDEGAGRTSGTSAASAASASSWSSSPPPAFTSPSIGWARAGGGWSWWPAPG